MSTSLTTKENSKQKSIVTKNKKKLIVPNVLLQNKTTENKIESIEHDKSSRSTSTQTKVKQDSVSSLEIISRPNEDQDKEDSESISSEENSTESVTDFFSLKRTPTVDSDDLLPIDIDTIEFLEKHTEKKVNRTEEEMKSPQKFQQENVHVEDKVKYSEHCEPTNIESTTVIGDEAMEHLCGKRYVKKRKTESENINVVDINYKDLKLDKISCLKALTDMQVHQSPHTIPKISSKHHITQLAARAKAREFQTKDQYEQNERLMRHLISKSES